MCVRSELLFKKSLLGFLLFGSSSSSSSESKKRSSCGFDGGFLNLWMYPSISWLFNLFSGLNLQREINKTNFYQDYLGKENPTYCYHALNHGNELNVGTKFTYFFKYPLELFLWCLVFLSIQTNKLMLDHHFYSDNPETVHVRLSNNNHKHIRMYVVCHIFFFNLPFGHPESLIRVLFWWHLIYLRLQF